MGHVPVKYDQATPIYSDIKWKNRNSNKTLLYGCNYIVISLHVSVYWYYRINFSDSICCAMLEK